MAGQAMQGNILPCKFLTVRDLCGSLKVVLMALDQQGLKGAKAI
jgi:hypothetical protein